MLYKYLFVNEKYLVLLCSYIKERNLHYVGISVGNDPDGYGFPVKGIIDSGTIKRDGSIQINDRITQIGNDPLQNVTIQQARAILRKAAMQEEVV